MILALFINRLRCYLQHSYLTDGVTINCIIQQTARPEISITKADHLAVLFVFSYHRYLCSIVKIIYFTPEFTKNIKTRDRMAQRGPLNLDSSLCLCTRVQIGCSTCMPLVCETAETHFNFISVH